MGKHYTPKYSHGQEIVLLRVDTKRHDVSLVIKIQRPWRLYKDQLTFDGIRNLVHSYAISNPKSVLRVINKCEAPLADKAAGLHVRFRLNGDSFPPSVVYKVYTHRPVVVMGSFSPRQYANGPRHCEGGQIWQSLYSNKFF
ncbi:hypothetical protein MPTK2_8g17010 [Marchantia polymorpha subsp. ruderalis]